MYNKEAIDAMITGHQQIIAGLKLLRQASDFDEATPEVEEFDPKDPANKYEIGGLEKLTARGAEICYRLFDSGKSRYAVASLLGISFGAANHRYQSWIKAGGRDRTRASLAEL